jgi:hypothetical protein
MSTVTYTTPQGCRVKRTRTYDRHFDRHEEHIELSTLEAEKHEGKTWPNALPSVVKLSEFLR